MKKKKKEVAAETMTRQEAAVYLGVHLRTVSDWIKNGSLKTIAGPRNRRLVLRASLVAMQPNSPKVTGVRAKGGGAYVNGFKVPPGFDAIETYDELKEYTVAFASGDLPLLLLIGPPGSGKSTQMHNDLVCKSPKHKWISNHTTLLALYCSVYKAANAPVVLDDVGHLLRTTNARSLLKALTQTDPVRMITWETTGAQLHKEKVPSQYETASPICLIANKWDSTDLDMAAIQDRATPVAFVPSAETIHKHVQLLGWCDKTVSNFVGKHLTQIPQPSMREYFHGMQYKKSRMQWQDKLLKRWGLL